RYLRVDGKPPSEYHDPIAGLYRCGDGRWARLHTNLPHHRDGVLALLGCRHERTAVQRALDQWEAEKLETAAAEAGLVVTACRTFREWDDHPQAAPSLARPSSASIRSATRRLSPCPRPSARCPGSRSST